MVLVMTQFWVAYTVGEKLIHDGLVLIHTAGLFICAKMLPVRLCSEESC